MSKPPTLQELQLENAALQLTNSALRQRQEQLLLRLLAQEQQITRLSEQVASLQTELTQRPPATPPPPPALPPFIKLKRQTKTSRQPRQQREPRQAHGRHLLPATTADVEVGYANCPTCDYQLSGQSEAWRHQVIELPPPPPLVVTNYIYRKRYCPHCQSYQTPPPGLAGIAIGQSHFGLNLVAHIAWLRTLAKLPLAFIGSYLRDLYQLELSEGEVCYLLGQVARQGEAEAEQIYQRLIAGPILHVDETSWKVNGRMGWVWTLANADGERYYQHSMSRAGAVAVKLLGAFKGVFHSDFYVGYNGCEQARQVCWVHLLRDLHQLEADYGAQVAELGGWIRAIKRLYRVGKWLAERDVGAEVRARWYSKLVSKLHGLTIGYAAARQHPASTLSKRLLQHEGSMFRYVLGGGVVADNNLAERSIRPLAVARKISGGSRSAEGAAVRMRLQTLFGTWLAKGLNPLQECLRMLGAKSSFQSV